MRRHLIALMLATTCLPWLANSSGAAPDSDADTSEEAGDPAGDNDATAEPWLEAILSADRQAIHAVRFGWRFDADFSAQMLDSFDDNEDGRFEAAELREASQSVYDTIKAYRYFLLVDDNGRDVAVKPAAQLAATFQEGRLSVTFEARPASPLALSGKIELGVYDPTFSIDFEGKGDMKAQDLPPTCSSALVQPDFDDVLARHPDALDDSKDPQGANIIQLFATRMVLTCQGKAG